MYRSVLVPIDDSPGARKALEVANELVDAQAGRLYLLNVQEPPLADDVLGHAAGAPADDADIRVQEAGGVVIERAIESAGPTGERTERLIRAGTRPAETIVEAASEVGADAIVIGSRGASDLAGLTLGSVSHKVLHTAACTVIVVR